MSADDSGESPSKGDLPNKGYVVGSGVQQNVFYGPVNLGGIDFGASDARFLASERQKLYFGFFRQALRQAETTFRLSVIFMSCGAAIILTSAILALINAGNPNLDYLPLVTSLTGVLITVGGGALAIHSNRARRHLAEQAEKLDFKIEEDHKLEKAGMFIERVRDANLKDRLRAITAMRALGISPDPDLTANQILPERSQGNKEIG